jgi:hypothetical protein
MKALRRPTRQYSASRFSVANTAVIQKQNAKSYEILRTYLLNGALPQGLLPVGAVLPDRVRSQQLLDVLSILRPARCAVLLLVIITTAVFILYCGYGGTVNHTAVSVAVAVGLATAGVVRQGSGSRGL